MIIFEFHIILSPRPQNTHSALNLTFISLFHPQQQQRINAFCCSRKLNRHAGVWFWDYISMQTEQNAHNAAAVDSLNDDNNNDDEDESS